MQTEKGLNNNQMRILKFMDDGMSCPQIADHLIIDVDNCRKLLNDLINKGYLKKGKFQNHKSYLYYKIEKGD